MTPTPRTDAIAHRGYGPDAYIVKTTDLCRELEREIAEVTAAIHKVHPTRRGSLIDMVEDLDSYRETAMNAFRLSEKELAAERALADRLAEALENATSWDYARPAFEAWKEARDT